MTTQQSEALRLADALDVRGFLGTTASQAAAELRRLAAENELLRQRHRDDNVEYTRMLTQRDALLEALRRHVELHDGDCICEDCAAIKAVEERK